MKTVTVRDLQKKLKECVDDAQEDRVVITRHGKPAAVLVGVEGEDWEAVVLQTDPKFWKLIRARRKQATISLGDLERRLRVESPSKTQREGRPARRRRVRIISARPMSRKERAIHEEAQAQRRRRG